MYRTIKDLIGYSIEATDGTCGRCQDFLFDDSQFTIRYMVAKTGGFLNRHEVLLSPAAFEDPDLGAFGKHMQVRLTKQQVEDSPAKETEMPVSREYELALARYYGQRPYWVGSDVWGFGPHPEPLPTPEDTEAFLEEVEKIRQHHLRSAEEVIGYRVEAQDGFIGSVTDFVVETKPWTIRRFVVDTDTSAFGHKLVLLAPSWQSGIRWEDRCVVFDLTVDQVKNAPPFDPHEPVNLGDDGTVHDYYGQPQRT